MDLFDLYYLDDYDRKQGMEPYCIMTIGVQSTADRIMARSGYSVHPDEPNSFDVPGAAPGAVVQVRPRRR